MTKTIEYRVRPVTRYIITRFEHDPHVIGACSSGSSAFGEYDNEGHANKVMQALLIQEENSHSNCRIVGDGIIEVQHLSDG